MAFQPENMPELKIFFLNIKSAWEWDDDKIIQLSFNYGVYNKDNNKFSELETFNNYIDEYVDWVTGEDTSELEEE